VIAVGDVLMLHDSDTGASKKDVWRPCMVLAITSTVAIVAPRSASVPGSVTTPPEASSAFNKDGHFSRWRRPVSRPVAEAADNHGQLAEPYLRAVLSLAAGGPG
jgi:hypothetical protein